LFAGLISVELCTTSFKPNHISIAGHGTGNDISSTQTCYQMTGREGGALPPIAYISNAGEYILPFFFYRILTSTISHCPIANTVCQISKHIAQ